MDDESILKKFNLLALEIQELERFSLNMLNVNFLIRYLQILREPSLRDPLIQTSQIQTLFMTIIRMVLNYGKFGAKP